jgi:hypothetical protein
MLDMRQAASVAPQAGRVFILVAPAAPLCRRWLGTFRSSKPPTFCSAASGTPLSPVCVRIRRLYGIMTFQASLATVVCQNCCSTRATRTVQILGSSGPESQNSPPVYYFILPVDLWYLTILWTWHSFSSKNLPLVDDYKRKHMRFSTIQVVMLCMSAIEQDLMVVAVATRRYKASADRSGIAKLTEWSYGGGARGDGVSRQAKF